MTAFFSITSWNCWLLRFPRLGAPCVSARRDLIAEILASVGADIIALQEVWHPFDQRRLAAALTEAGYHYFHYDRRNYGSGLFLASRHPIISSDFHKHTAKARGAEKFLAKGFCSHQIDAAGRTVTVTNIHLGAEVDEGPRLEDLERVIAASETYKITNIFLAGDFNFGRHSAGYERLRRHGYIDCHSDLPEEDKPTLEQENPHVPPVWKGKTVDFVFCKGQSPVVTSAETIGSFRKTKTFYSDHTGLFARFQL